MASSYHARRERHAPVVHGGPTPTTSATAASVPLPMASPMPAQRSTLTGTEAPLDQWSRLGRHSSEELNRLALSPLVRRKRAHGQLAPHEQLYVTLKRIKAAPSEAHHGHSVSRPHLALRASGHASSTALGPSASSSLMTKAGRSRTVPATVTGEPPAPEEESGRPVRAERAEPSRPMTVRGRHFRERLRNAILDEDKDALRRRVRELESEKLALSDKVSQRKTKILQYKAAKLEQDTKYFRLATENARLRSEVKEAQRDKQVADQSHVRELKEVRLRLEAMKKKAEKAEFERAKVESQLSQSTGGESFLQDILCNFKEMLETNLQCSICSEVLILSTTVSCGHTFCEDCIASWKEKTIRRWPTCPICRTVIDFQASNLVLDDYIDKVVETFFPEETRKIRADMLQDRRVKKTNRDQASKAREGRLRHFFLSQFGDSDNESSRGDGFSIQEVDLPGRTSSTTSSSPSESSVASVVSDGSFSPASSSSVVRSSTSGSRSSSRSRSRTPEPRLSPVRSRSVSPVVNQFSSDHELTEDEDNFGDPLYPSIDDEQDDESIDFDEPQYQYQDESPGQDQQEDEEPVDEADLTDTEHTGYLECVDSASTSFDFGDSDGDDMGI